MAVKASFADLTHMGQVVAANTFPLGASMVASYAKKELGDELELEIFKYPDDLAAYFDKNTPQFACFSAFSWNIRLGHEYARRIKAASPGTITVFGGPNFPDAPEEQAIFLEHFPHIDCYFEFEGEISFVAFFRALKEIGFDWRRFRDEKRLVQNIRYLSNGEFVAAPLAPKIEDPNIVPSPHLGGLSDKFYDGVLIPMIQSTRGCPYQCAFCWEGGPYFQKIKRFEQARVESELRYISERVGKVPDLCIVDANFGIFPEDMSTAREIHRIQQSHENRWPRTVLAATAKNNKERTIEIVELLKETLPPTGAVQSTDKTVLDNIKRKNVANDVLAKMAKVTEEQGGQSEAELILCLEGDNKRAHFQTVKDMLDSSFSFVRMYQFMMLPGTKSASRLHREKYGFRTRFRVLPRCFGKYRFRGESFHCAEIEEIVTGNSTMTHEEYLQCRALHLTVEVFHNDSIFLDLAQLLERRGVRRSEFIETIYNTIFADSPEVARLYAEFNAEENKNTWEKLSVLEEFVAKEGVLDRYIAGEYGTNELYKYRALAVFQHLPALHEIVYSSARKLLAGREALSPELESYLSELKDFSLLRKAEVLNTTLSYRRVYHYDFPALLERKFEAEPGDYHRPEGVEVEILHTGEQRALIESYIRQYTTTLIGLGRILLRANMNRLYRTARGLSPGGPGRTARIPEEVLAKTDRLGGDRPKP